jgi:hypothetical protein
LQCQLDFKHLEGKILTVNIVTAEPVAGLVGGSTGHPVEVVGSHTVSVDRRGPKQVRL